MLSREEIRKHKDYIIGALIIIVAIIIIVFMSRYTMYRVAGNSMYDTLYNKDLVLVKRCGMKDISKGDIIVYIGYSDEVIIHRVTASVTDINGRKYLITKGDNNEDTDALAVSSSMIIGKYVAKLDTLQRFIDEAKEYLDYSTFAY